MIAGDLLSWWLEQLHGLTPPALRRALLGPRRTLVLRLAANQLSLWSNDSGRPEPLGAPLTLAPGPSALSSATVWQDDPDTPVTAIRRALERLGGPAERVRVELAASRYLLRELELPLAAERDLREAMGFQIGRLTPFQSEQVIYHCGVSSRRPADQRLRAWVAVVPRQPLQELQGWCDRAGLTLPEAASGRLIWRANGSGSQRPQPGQPLSLVYRPQGARPGWWHPRLYLLLLALAGSGLAAWQHLDNVSRELTQIRREVQRLEQDARRASAWQTAIDRQLALAQTLREAHESAPLVVALLEDLTRRLPDDTWLQRLELNADVLNLQGVSGTAAALIGLLEASPMLGDVRFQSSVTRDTRTGGERFNLSARVITPAGGPADAGDGDTP